MAKGPYDLSAMPLTRTPVGLLLLRLSVSHGSRLSRTCKTYPSCLPPPCSIGTSQLYVAAPPAIVEFVKASEVPVIVVTPCACACAAKHASAQANNTRFIAPTRDFCAGKGGFAAMDFAAAVMFMMMRIAMFIGISSVGGCDCPE
ncbi:MAG: hypothetical protein OD817_07120 [Gammaproteobacteria bacterium]